MWEVGQRVAYVYRPCADQILERRAASAELEGDQSCDFVFVTRGERELVKTMADEVRMELSRAIRKEDIRCGAYVEFARVSHDGRATLGEELDQHLSVVATVLLVATSERTPPIGW